MGHGLPRGYEQPDSNRGLKAYLLPVKNRDMRRNPGVEPDILARPRVANLSANHAGDMANET
jgi:hypothetical protein